MFKIYRFLHRPPTLFPHEFKRKEAKEEMKSLNFQFVTSNEAINVEINIK